MAQTLTKESPRPTAAACNLTFEEHVERLHRFTVAIRWLVIAACWAIVAPLALWGMRGEFDLWRSHFTLAALRYGLRYNWLSTLGLSFCLGLTTATLLWQSRNILFGRSRRYERELEKQVRYILAFGPRHPLWRWTVGNIRS